MIKLILYGVVFIVAIYILVWLKNKWNTLHPNTKKQIMFLGLNGVFSFLRLKWQIILIAIWQVLKRFLKK
jgi:uncharacterized membrane protein